MADLKLIFVFSCLFALLGLSHVEATSRTEREVETAQEPSQMENVQQQLMNAFDNVKKSVEELASKLNYEDIVQGVQSITSKLEGYAKQAADQFATTASGTASADTKNEEPVPQQPSP